MKSCRVCGAELFAPIYESPAPSLTSLTGVLDVPTTLFVCKNCSHGQAADLPNASDFYDHEYRISLNSEEYDQLCAIEDGQPVFRTDLQASLVLTKASPSQGAMILDFGAGKATTLQKICRQRPDLLPHVFDMSSDYLPHWRSWLKEGQFATYSTPQRWSKMFEVVTAHFVMEHILDPVASLSQIRGLLREGGTLFLSVPNLLANKADLLAVDHVNHFTEASLDWALRTAGFEIAELDKKSFDGAFLVVAVAVPALDERSLNAAPNASKDIECSIVKLEEVARFWRDADTKLAAFRSQFQGRRASIYGAGVYGSYIYSKVARDLNIECFIDQNPHIRSAPHMGKPVISPGELPTDIELVFAGLNPRNAKSILSSIPEWQSRQPKLLFLE